ncbi:MAG TPA: hypothetical protein VFN18_11070 [Solirubrobacterales bacterium]|nr:hypothetical protein [Solirubrobacterales bacterium]
MARLNPLLLALLMGAASAAALASCGGSDAELLPGTTAEQIESNLDQVEELAANDDCIGAEDAVAEVTEEVEGLEGVDLKLKTALQEGTARLSEVVAGCEEETTEETEPTVESNVGDEEVEDEKKAKKEKPEKEKAEPKEEESEGEGPDLPPQSNGKGEEKGKGGEEPPAETEPEAEETPSSGGVGPSEGVE